MPQNRFFNDFVPSCLARFGWFRWLDSPTKKTTQQPNRTFLASKMLGDFATNHAQTPRRHAGQPHPQGSPSQGAAFGATKTMKKTAPLPAPPHPPSPTTRINKRKKGIQSPYHLPNMPNTLPHPLPNMGAGGGPGSAGSIRPPPCGAGAC